MKTRDALEIISAPGFFHPADIRRWAIHGNDFDMIKAQVKGLLEGANLPVNYDTIFHAIEVAQRLVAMKEVLG